MRSILANLSCLLLVSISFADEKPKPNTLTPKEIATGWILLFDGETSLGWNIGGESLVDDGALTIGGKRATIATTTSRFSCFDLTFEFRSLGASLKIRSVDRGLGSSELTD